MNKLEQLRSMTDVVADTGDIQAIARYKPQDATTNPSLILKAAQLPHYAPLLSAAADYARQQGGSNADQLAQCSDFLAVKIGAELAKLVPGRVSTEVDARLSYNTQAMLERAKRLVDLYEDQNVDRSRILIKLASTWEGIRAAEVLEKEGVNCNLTLLFGFQQAQACADAGVFLISPFVGRILDWYKSQGQGPYEPDQDPGVRSVRRIYEHYKACGYYTVVMGASFRNIGQIEALAGCDRLTISPDLLAQLEASEGRLERKLVPEGASGEKLPAINENDFRLSLNQDAMAYEKLGDGIRRFIIDQQALETQLAERIGAQ